MNYKIQPTEAPEIFTLEDESGNPIADVRGKALAEKFAALPDFLNALKEVHRVFSVRANEGCSEKTWHDFQNGNGEDIGLEIEHLLGNIDKLISK